MLGFVQSSLCVIIAVGAGLAVRSGSGAFSWLGIELRTLGMLGIMLVRGFPGLRVALYLTFNAIGSALLFWGLVAGGNILAVWFGIWIKIGIPPFHAWVWPVVEPIDSVVVYYFFIFVSKIGPLWVGRWSLRGETIGTEFVFALGLGALFGTCVGLLRGDW
jgi:hypothetical protein